jgi:hypothetical protein
LASRRLEASSRRFEGKRAPGFDGRSYRDAIMRKTLSLAVLVTGAALWLLSGEAAAQTAYKYQRPDGSFVFSDKPIEGAKLVETIVLNPTRNVVASPPASSAGAKAATTEADRIARERSFAIESADAEIKAAQQAVADARQALQDGSEPGEGERVGNANGGSRLRDEYFQRVARLEQELKDALDRLDEAYKQRDQVK